MEDDDDGDHLLMNVKFDWASDVYVRRETSLPLRP